MIKLKKIINNIDEMLLILILIAFTLFMKNKEVITKIQIAINILIIIYIILRLVKKLPVQIIESKLDIFVILLVVSTIIPIIFNTYVSLESTIISILSYTTILWIYLLTKKISNRESSVRHIKKIIIIITLVLIILGIDNITANKIFTLFNIQNFINGEQRLVSLLGNPNTFAILIIIAFFISMNEMINAKNEKNKILYGTSNTVLMLGLILTYSKLSFLVFAFLLFPFFILLKNTEKRIKMVINIIISVIMIIIYLNIFYSLYSRGKYEQILMFSIFWILCNIVLNIFDKKIFKYLKNIKLKRVIIYLCIIFLIIGVCFFIGLYQKKELVVFQKGFTELYQSKKINNINPNTKYKLQFDMEAEIFGDSKENAFTITVVERDSRSLDKITSTEYSFSSFKGTKEIEIVTSPYTSEIKLEFRINKNELAKSWIIYDLRINGEEVILEYRYLPTKLIEKIKNINIQYRTSQERIEFIKDGFKLISHSFLTGNGGDGWRLKYGEVQEYGYITNDAHSYYMQSWIDYGILSIISIVGIAIFVIRIKYQDEKQKATYMGVQIGIIALLMHSMLDSDMYYIYMKVIIFILLGLLSTLGKRIVNVKKGYNYFINYTAVIVSIISIFLLVKPESYKRVLVVQNLEKELSTLEKDNEEYIKCNQKIVNECKKLIKYERDEYTKTLYEVKIIEGLISSKDDSLIEFIKQYYEKMSNYKNKWKYQNDRIIDKSNLITIVNRMLQEQNDNRLKPWIDKLAQLNINEFEETKNELILCCKTNNKKLEEQMEYEILEINYEYAIMTLNLNS